MASRSKRQRTKPLDSRDDAQVEGAEGIPEPPGDPVQLQGTPPIHARAEACDAVGGASTASRDKVLLQQDALTHILRHLSRNSGCFDHALVCKDWLEAAQYSQLAVRIRQGAKLRENDLISILNRFPDLQSLHLQSHSIKSITDEVVAQISRMGTSLRELVFKPVPAFPARGRAHEDHSEEVWGTLSGDQLRTLLSGLPQLMTLSLQGIQADVIPECLSDLRSLECLCLGGIDMALTDIGDNGPELPKEIGSLTGLRSLYTMAFDVAEVPEWLSSLARLTALAMAVTCEELPSKLVDMTQLVDLQLDLPFVTRLPDWIGDFPLLNSLALYAQVTMLPRGLWRLTRLERLHLHCRTPRIPLAIGSLVQLRSLSLSGSSSLRHLPGSLTSLRLLTELLADDESCFASCLDSALTCFSNLENLVLSGSWGEGNAWLEGGVVGAPPHHLFLPQPPYSLSSCLCHNAAALSGAGASDTARSRRASRQRGASAPLASFPRLQGLYLNHVAYLPADWAPLALLRKLSINFCGQPRLPDSICSLLQLQSLELTVCKLQELPAKLGRLKALQVLHLECLEGMRSLPLSLTQLSSLRTLRVWDLSLLRSVPKGLEQMTSLRRLYVGHCLSLDVVKLMGGLPHRLEEMVLDTVPWDVRLETDEEVFRGLRRLKSVELERIEGLKCLPIGLSLLTQLEMLRVKACRELETVPRGYVGLANLEELRFIYCPNIRNVPRRMLNLPSLTERSKLLLRRVIRWAEGPVRQVPHNSEYLQRLVWNLRMNPEEDDGDGGGTTSEEDY